MLPSQIVSLTLGPMDYSGAQDIEFFSLSIHECNENWMRGPFSLLNGLLFLHVGWVHRLCSSQFWEASSWFLLLQIFPIHVPLSFMQLGNLLLCLLISFTSLTQLDFWQYCFYWTQISLLIKCFCKTSELSATLNVTFEILTQFA